MGAAILALLVAAGGVVFATTRDGSADPWGSYGEGWTELPVGPGTRFTTYAWAGSELVAWGDDGRGSSGPDTAYTFDPASKIWAQTAPAPTGGFVAAAVWTGSELLFFVGSYHPGMAVVGFDPERNAWDSFDRSPRGPNLLSSYTWTGRDVVVFGGVDQLHGIEEGTDRAWSFDAASGAWSELPSAPVRMSAPTAAWSGQELIAAGWSGPLLHPSTDSLQTVAFDPASSAWRTLPDTQLGIVPTGAVAVDGRPIIWQPSADSSFEWRKAAGAWTPIPAPYLGGGGCPVDTAAISSFAFGWACGHPAVFSAATSSWSPVDPPITWDATITPPGVAVAVGDGFVVSAFVPTPGAGATEGSPDTHLWFWRPPTP